VRAAAFLLLLAAAPALAQPPTGSTDPFPGGAIVATVGATYGAVYLLTPFDLDWHLHTSLSRLALQLWPSLLFLLLLLPGPADREPVSGKMISAS